MSHIDTLKHQRLGTINDLEVYLLLEKDDSEFKAKAGTVVLGGGGGEHAPIVVRNLTYCVANYIDESGIYADEAIDEILMSSDRFTAIEFVDWTVASYYFFYENFVNNGVDLETDNVENLVTLAVGKLIFEKYDSLNPLLHIKKLIYKGEPHDR